MRSIAPRTAPVPVLAAGLLLAAAAGAQLEPLPTHPRELSFAPASYRPPAPERRELAGGAVVYLAPDRGLPLVELVVALRVGSFLESRDEVGLAQMTAALLRRGGAGERDADALDTEIDLLGAELDTVNDATTSGIRLSVPSWELEPALDLVFDILARPRLQEDRLEVLRTNALEAMGRRNQDPLAILEREWNRILFRGYYGSWEMTPATLERLDRAALERFHRAHWRPDELILALSGDFDPEEAVADLERRLTDWRDQAGARTTETPWPPPRPPRGVEPGIYLVPSEAPQAKVMLGHRLHLDLAWESRERLALEFLAEVLGGRGAISRLGGRLRAATGLVYRVDAQIEPGQPEPGPPAPGYFQVFFETDPGNAARALELTREEIERLQARPISRRELETVRRTLLDRLRGWFDTPEKIAGRHSENELLERPADYWKTWIEHVRAIQPEEIRRAARAHLRPTELRVLIVGPEPGELLVAQLEQAVQRRVVRLPRRDPLTLEPVSAENDR